MKVYAIKRHDGYYVKYDENSYFALTPKTKDPKTARCYKKKGTALGVVNRAIADTIKSVEYYQEMRAHYGNGATWCDTKIADSIARQKEMEKWKVVELDIDKPLVAGNKTKTPKIVINNSSEIGVTTKNSQGNIYCKGCGVYFKQIPFMQFGLWDKPARICPLCIIERAKDAQTLLDDMDEERRKEFETERFAHRLG